MTPLLFVPRRLDMTKLDGRIRSDRLIYRFLARRVEILNSPLR